VLGSERVAFARTPAQPFLTAKVDYVAVISSWRAWELIITEKLVLTLACFPLLRFPKWFGHPETTPKVDIRRRWLLTSPTHSTLSPSLHGLPAHLHNVLRATPALRL
jgi:hypothetical protein